MALRDNNSCLMMTKLDIDCFVWFQAKNILKYLFPVPKEDSRRVVTFANTDDYISFRWANVCSAFVTSDVADYFCVPDIVIDLTCVIMSDWAIPEYTAYSFTLTISTCIWLGPQSPRGRGSFWEHPNVKYRERIQSAVEKRLARCCTETAGQIKMLFRL